MTQLVLESELPLITKQIKEKVANIVNRNEDPAYCSALRKKYLDICDKKLSCLLLTEQITFFPFVTGLDGLHRVYLVLKEKAQEAGTSESFYDVESKENKWREAYNIYIDDINSALTEESQTKNAITLIHEKDRRFFAEIEPKRDESIDDAPHFTSFRK